MAQRGRRVETKQTALALFLKFRPPDPDAAFDGIDEIRAKHERAVMQAAEALLLFGKHFRLAVGWPLGPSIDAHLRKIEGAPRLGRHFAEDRDLVPAAIQGVPHLFEMVGGGVRGEVDTESVRLGFLDQFHCLGHEPLAKVWFAPVEKIAVVGFAILAAWKLYPEIRVLPDKRRIFGDAPGDDVQKDADVALVSSLHEAPDDFV